MFTPSGLCLYQHALDHRLLTRDILALGLSGSSSLFGNVLGQSTRLFLSCLCSRIAPYDHLNVAFWSTLTMQCIKFVLLPLKVKVQIKGPSLWQQYRALPTASAGTPFYLAV